MIQYRYYLSCGMVSRQARPIFKDDLSLEYAFEQGQMFRRSTLSGDMAFVGEDYDFIMAMAFDAKIDFLITVRWSERGLWYSYWRGYFYRTDCTINIDDRKVTVKPTVNDRYNKILAGLDKEYDLIKLDPAIQPVNLTRRPMVQIYASGDSVVSCFLAGMQWEQDANVETSEGKLRDTYHFAKVDDYAEIQFTGTVPSGLGGVFIGTIPQTSATGEWRRFENEAQQYYISYFQEYTHVDEQFNYKNGLRVYAEADPSTVLWVFEQDKWTQDPDDDYDPIPDDFTMRSTREGVDALTAEMIQTPVFARWVCADTTYGGWQTYPIPDGDIVPNNRNYKYCYPLNSNDIVEMSYRYQTEPTQWGVRPDGKYYLPPEVTSPNTLDYFPMARTTWGYASIWFRYTVAVNNLEPQGRKATRINDAFAIEGVISALLKEVDPTITFAPTTAYSQVLFGTTPLTSYFGRLVMTPKSNILVAEYTQPARKAPITLGEVLEMLRKAMGCYWFVDDDNRLRIEHVSWFKNGGSYNGTPTVGIDLTAMANSRNGKMWSFATGQYSFDKVQMPERYQYEWMDDTTDIFKGSPIEVLSGYVQEGNIEEVTVSKFNSDVDYMMLNPSNVSEDGFALLCCTIQDGEWNVSLEQLMLSPYQYQNWQLAFYSLQRWFLISDMPAWDIRIDGVATVAKGIQRMKKQQVSIPLDGDDPDMEKLIKTTIGDGEVEKMTIRLMSRMAKTTLRYDTVTRQ